MRDDQPRFLELTVKTIVVHTVTYFLVGALAFSLLDYATLYSRPDMAGFIRQTTDPMVMAGPLFQPIRGVIFALVIYPLRRPFLERNNGWLLLWWVLVALASLRPLEQRPGPSRAWCTPAFRSPISSSVCRRWFCKRLRWLSVLCTGSTTRAIAGLRG